MRYKAVLGLIPACALFCGAVAYGKRQTADAKLFSQKLSKTQQIEQAVSRLTFGPRPGDAAEVARIGLKKWIDRQLHPAAIAESPTLEQKLKFMDSLGMSSAEMVRNYPSPQLVKLMVAGRADFPTDPERRRMIEKQVAKAEAKQGDKAKAEAPELPKIADLLTPRQLRTLRTGSAAERLAVLKALPPEKLDEVIAVLPAGARNNLFAVAPPDLRRKIELTAAPQQVVARDLSEGKLLRAIYSNRQLEAVLDDFWFNHFNVFLDKGADRYLVTEYERDTIRPRVLGKFRDLLEATAKSPAMLFYLDNWQSVGPNAAVLRGNQKKGVRGLNENYGRELLELHTLGVDGGYTQKDVTEVARCFTGWTIADPQRGGTFVFNKRLHDAGEKTVLGVKIPAGGGIEDGEKVLDIVAHHAATAHFLSKKLAQRFVADNPPESLVAKMAETFQKSDGDLRAVMQTMLESKEFWSVGAYQSKVKTPLETVASAVRAVNGDVDYAFPLVNQIAQLGQPLYRKQEPTGYSNSSQEWLNSAGLLARMNFAVQLSKNQIPGVKVESADASVLGAPAFQKK
jgi:uncharacterized protein (DUF1800 family)